MQHNMIDIHQILTKSHTTDQHIALHREEESKKDNSNTEL